MRIFLSSICSLLLQGATLSAQAVQTHFVREIPIVFEDSREAELSFQANGESLKDFCAISLRLDGKGLSHASVQCLLQIDGVWMELGHFEEEELPGRFASALFFAGPQVVEVKARVKLLNHDCEVESGMLRLFSPTGALSASKIIPNPSPKDAQDCPQPSYTPRNSWGTAWGLNSGIYIPPAYFTNVTHLIVHHSAGSNSSSNWPGVVAAIFDYHVNTNGWADVGYNWLIDPLGGIYEGRGGGNNVRGSHMCGYNSNTMGVCYMGNFMLVSPPPPGMQALVQLLAWKCGDSNINPLGNGPIASFTNNMKNISGHKDGCAPSATACPGDSLYPLLAKLRIQVNDYINNVCNPSSGLDPLRSEAAPQIFPNPSQGTFAIRWPNGVLPANATLSLFDATGREIWNGVQVQEDGQVFITDDLPSGLYLLHIQGVQNAWIKLHI
jgi:N-acetylmuramoyl-L-alanine amidase/Secretion system C-terminal sorting domain